MPRRWSSRASRRHGSSSASAPGARCSSASPRPRSACCSCCHRRRRLPGRGGHRDRRRCRLPAAARQLRARAPLHGRHPGLGLRALLVRLLGRRRPGQHRHQPDHRDRRLRGRPCLRHRALPPRRRGRARRPLAAGSAAVASDADRGQPADRPRRRLSKRRDRPRVASGPLAASRPEPDGPGKGPIGRLRLGPSRATMRAMH